MNKITLLSCLLAIGLIACKNSKNAEKSIDKLGIAKTYFKALDNADESQIASLMTDSILTKETEYDYEQTFALAEYVEWIKWDAVFDPTYEILEIAQEGDIVKAKISKVDKRILFLHEAPIITNQVIRFTNDKISTIETQYEFFNDSMFVGNRDSLVSWINKNQPELNGFIHDQTEAGGKNYLRAIALYKNK